MEVLKLKLRSTGKTVGSSGWTEYEPLDLDEVKDEKVNIDTILIKGGGEIVSILIVGDDSVPKSGCYCARLESYGDNKINAIKAVREATAFGLKESKDFVESFPHTIKDKSRETLKILVDSINSIPNAKATLVLEDCDTCPERFKCFTER